jgi:hypothetical protein
MRSLLAATLRKDYRYFALGSAYASASGGLGLGSIV